jgi:hypothetical protein
MFRKEIARLGGDSAERNRKPDAKGFAAKFAEHT